MPWKAERTRTAWPTFKCSYFLFTSARSTALTVTVVDGCTTALRCRAAASRSPEAVRQSLSVQAVSR